MGTAVFWQASSCLEEQLSLQTRDTSNSSYSSIDFMYALITVTN